MAWGGGAAGFADGVGDLVVAGLELVDLGLQGGDAGPAVVSSMVPFSNAVKYRPIAACLVLIWARTAPASACRSA
jgi:hypothetical protein